MTADMKSDAAVGATTPCEATETDAGLEAILKILARYQSAIKTVGAIAFVLLATALIGLGVQFIYTLPLLILVPLAAQLWCRRPLPILLTGYVGAAFFAWFGAMPPRAWFALTVFSIMSITVGVMCGLLVGWALKHTGVKRMLLAVTAGVLLVAGCFASARYTGTPFTYVHTYNTVSAYMKKTYANRPEVKFSLKRIWVDRDEFWHQYLGGQPEVIYTYESSYTLNQGDNTVSMSLDKVKTIPGGFNRDDEGPWKLFISTRGYHEEVGDGYLANVLSQAFYNEQITRLTPYVLSAVGFDPTTQVSGSVDLSADELSQLREEYLDYYVAWKPLASEMARKKAALEDKTTLSIYWAVPSSEQTFYRKDKSGNYVKVDGLSGKGGEYSDDTQHLSKEEFVRRAAAIYEVLREHKVPYESVAIYSGLKGHEKTFTMQQVMFNKGDSLAKMLASYSDQPQ